eukprot:TRINITY_DN56994_c0_g1_i1.p1 TRINITY_DN56994_c0_g1~~TRINITY_DN56994_c0_g1_i1.p1  ORF type:complete len:205 (+),score=40.85 TRINITY_DN56994_c0_g1_i1:65-679(+)
MVNCARLSLVLAALLRGSNGAKCPSDPPGSCSNLDFDRYKGRWYQQVDSKAFFFGSGLQCVTANYSMKSDGTIKVFNTGSKGSPTGSLSTAEGSATVGDASKCELKVSFSRFQPVASPYRIIETDYTSYAIVASCLSAVNFLDLSALWVLSRTPRMDADKLNDLVKHVVDLGYKWDDQRFTNQNETCNYPDATLGAAEALEAVV